MSEKKPFKPGEQKPVPHEQDSYIDHNNQDFDAYQGYYEKRDSRDETDFLQMIRGSEDND